MKRTLLLVVFLLNLAVCGTTSADPRSSGENYCKQKAIAVQLDGIDRDNYEEMKKDLCDVLDQHFIPDDERRKTVGSLETTISRPTLNPFDIKTEAGALLVGFLPSDRCQSQHDLDELLIPLKRDLKKYSKQKSSAVPLFGKITADVIAVVDLEDLFTKHTCESDYIYLLVRYNHNHFITASDLPAGCLRYGTYIGSESWSTDMGLNFSIINPFDTSEKWCHSAIDLANEVERMKACSNLIKSVEVERETFLASLIKEHLGIQDKWQYKLPF